MNTDKNFDQIDELILAFLRGTIIPEDLAYLKNWLTENKANKDYFKKMYILWKANSVADQDDERVDKAFQKVCRKIFEIDEEGGSSFKERQGHFGINLLKWAAVVFLSVCAGGVLSYLYMRNLSNRADNITQNEINVPLGSKSKIILPDHTEVWLNAGSKLTYSMSYGKKLREVNLEGEGYFKVFKMPDKPFIVHTLKANIKALGTEFNVKAYPDENTIETILVKGLVVVDKLTASGGLKDSKNKKSIVLSPGQKVLIYKTDIPEEKGKEGRADDKKDQPSEKGITKQMSIENEMNPLFSDAEVETSWKDPSWVIQGESLKDLCIKLGRRFNVIITPLNKELDKYKFSGIIQNETLEQVFELMSLTIPMSYSVEKGKVEIAINWKLESKYKRAYKN